MRQAHKRSRNPRVKKLYRVKNWSQYDKALRDRGDITIWFSPDAFAGCGDDETAVDGNGNSDLGREGARRL